MLGIVGGSGRRRGGICEATKGTGVGTATRSGDVLAGRYRLIDLLSESGGGRFWRARDAILERFVALHVIAEDDPRASGLVDAARTSAGVLDPRILRVLDAEREDGRCFVVNEWGTGISLDILVTNAGPLSPRRAAWLVHHVADALARAHEAGVTHGRLNPENVLIDRHGQVRLIGMCVDAALHGLEPADERADLEDLAGILYCTLTATWPGPSGSIVPAAPREHGRFLSPRQVVAGVPMPLDLLWRTFDAPPTKRIGANRRRKRAADKPDISCARSIGAYLLDFVGDPAGMPESLAAAIPRINELRPVWLPALDDPLPHDSSRDDLPVVAAPTVTDTAERASSDDSDTDADTDAAARGPVVGDTETGTDDAPPIPLVTDLPTEPGMPVFGNDDDVEWLRTRSTPPPPPPPFEDLPDRPLFAPDPPEGPPIRRPVPPASDPGGLPPSNPDLLASGARQAGFWPWDPDAVEDDDTDTDAEAVPGRSWLRLAMVVGAAVLVLVAVAIAFNLGRGREPLGGTSEEPTPTPTPTVSVVRGVAADDLDPFGGDGAENPEQVANLVDGKPATTWRTATYNDQLGPPPGLKTGVGAILDLGQERTIDSVEIQVVGGPITVSVSAYERPPTGGPNAEPLATATGAGTLTLTPTGPAADDGGNEGRYVVVWLTKLPPVDGGFRGEIGEVVVRAG